MIKNLFKAFKLASNAIKNFKSPQNAFKALKSPKRPTREQVDAVQAREVAEASRQRLANAIEERTRQVNSLVIGVLPKRGQEQ